MQKSIAQLIDQLKASNATLVLRTGAAPSSPHLGKLPKDLLEFSGKVQRAVVFNPECGRNTWDIFEDTCSVPLMGSAASYSRVFDPKTSYYENCYFIANNCTTGIENIIMDLHPLRHGWIFPILLDSTEPDIDCRVIAKSFTEWLERVIDAGPDGRAYWRQPGFEDYGPAIPEDFR